MHYNIVDILLIVFILILFVNGFRRGLIMAVFDFIGVMIALLIAWKYNNIVNTFMFEKTGIAKYINENISSKLTKILSDIPLDKFNIGNILKGYEKLPFDIQKLLDNFIGQGNSVNSFSSYTDGLADKITYIFVLAIGFAVTFLIAYLILIIVVGVLGNLLKTPVLNIANKILGGTFGVLKSIVLLYIIFAIATPFIAMSKENNDITTEILSSKSSEIFYENNLILNYLTYKGILND